MTPCTVAGCGPTEPTSAGMENLAGWLMTEGSRSLQPSLR
jgi:hypothetical protein